MTAPTASKIKGVAFAIMLFISSLFGVLVFGGCLLPIFFLRPVFYRQLFDYMIGIWLWMAAALLEMLIGLDVTVTGDEMRANEPSIIIMNHRSRLDWMYFWCALARQPSGIMTEKIILKAPLKHVPGPGWAMQVASFLFVQRRWDQDQQYLTTMLDYFTNINYIPQILIFPEGTDFTKESCTRSDEFAVKNGLQCYKNVLQPRSTGFVFLMNYVRQNWPKAAVYDVTLVYPGIYPQNESQLVAGVLPESVQFHIKRYSVANDLPTEPADVERWLRCRWNEKNNRLESIGGAQTLSPPQCSALSDWIHIYYRLSVAFWLAFDLFVLVVLLSCSAVSWLLLVISVFFVYVGLQRGGFELVQAHYVSSRASSVKAE